MSTDINDIGWYRNNELKSRNKLFNFVIGLRTGGKTFAFKEDVIKDFIENGNQFIWVRRFETEFDDNASFCDDVLFKFENIEFKVTRKYLYINKKRAGFFIPLSQQLKYKSVSYKKVNKIVYDEFLIPSGNAYRYLPNEVDDFLNLYSTVARLREITDGVVVKAYFIANSISIVNPYFIHWNVYPSKGRFTTWNKASDKNKREICIEVFNGGGVKDNIKKTRFYTLVEGTQFSDFAIDTKFNEDNLEFIGKRTKKVKYIATFFVNNVNYAFWYDFNSNIAYIDKDYQENNKSVFCFQEKDFGANRIYVKNGRDVFEVESFIIAFRDNRCYFRNQQSKKDMFKVLKLLNIF